MSNVLYFIFFAEILRFVCLRSRSIMFVKSMVIDGFKSYGTRTEINGFDPMFNAITGLNGSGTVTKQMPKFRLVVNRVVDPENFHQIRIRIRILSVC